MRQSFVAQLTFGLASLLFFPALALAQSDFNPHFIISDPELQDSHSWDRTDIQKFLDDKGSYLRTGIFEDASGTFKSAAEIIYDASQRYQVSPKFLLVTLQKEQSLVTDDSPTSRQLDWATGYAVCDGCYINDPKVQRYKGFGKQVDGAAGIMRWYYDNENSSFVKKKDTPIRIDETDVTPGSWATAFLYTYTPHLHGNANFWRIWNTWFSQMYPSGTLLQSSSSSDYWLVQDGSRRHFKNKTALITRFDPKLAIKVDDIDLQNYKLGQEIVFPNYSLLTSGSTTYFLDKDVIRPFASDDVIRYLGFNPDEVIDAEPGDLAGLSVGSTITASSTAPQGAVFKITDAGTYYLLKDGMLFPIPDPAIVQTNFKYLPLEKHKLKDLSAYQTADTPVRFADGTLLQIKDSITIYVMENGKKRPLADDDTFIALGYKKTNVIPVSQLTAMNIPTGDAIFINNSLTSARNKYLGDNEEPVNDSYGKATSAEYLVAEFPSGRILSGKNIDTRRPIASLTKLMTAYESLHEDFNVTKSTIYSGSLYTSDKNALKLHDGDKIRNKDMFYAMLVASDNSAARLVAQNTSLGGEDDLVRKMNLRLEEWGADYTSIADVTGLSEKNKSTARDLLKIFTRVLTENKIKDALGTTAYSFSELKSKDALKSHSFKNTNQIIAGVPNSRRSYKILATKTGYTDEAGGVLIMLIQAKKTGKQYVIITMGNPDYPKRFEEPHKIADWISTQKISLVKK